MEVHHTLFSEMNRNVLAFQGVLATIASAVRASRLLTNETRFSQSSDRFGRFGCEARSKRRDVVRILCSFRQWGAGGWRLESFGKAVFQPPAERPRRGGGHPACRADRRRPSGKETGESRFEAWSSCERHGSFRSLDDRSDADGVWITPEAQPAKHGMHGRWHMAR